MPYVATGYWVDGYVGLSSGPIVIDSTTTMSISASEDRYGLALVPSGSALSVKPKPWFYIESASHVSISAFMYRGGAALLDLESSISISSNMVISASIEPIESTSTIGSYFRSDLSEGLIFHTLLNNNGHEYVDNVFLSHVGSIDYTGRVLDCSNGAASYQPTLYNWGSKRSIYSIWASPKEVFQYYQFIIGSANDTYSVSNFGWFLNFYNNRIAIHGVALVNSPVFEANVERHFILSADHVTGDYSWHLDGLPMGSGNNNLLTSAVVGTILQIGGFKTFSSTYSRGVKVSNLRIYENSITDALAYSLYKEGTFPKPLPIPTLAGAIGYYALDGDARDEITGAYGINYGSSTYIDDPQFGIVADFRGGADHIGTPVTAVNSPSYFGVSFWSYYDSDGDGYATLVGGDGFEIYQRPTTFSLYTTGGFSNEFTTTRVSTKWQHYFFSVENSTQLGKLYINGAFRESKSDAFTIGEMQILYLGGYGDISNTDGKLRNVRMYIEPLTDKEIEDIYIYETNFRGAAGLPILTNPSSESVMSVKPTLSRNGYLTISSQSEMTTIDSMLAGISIHESNSFSLSITATLDIGGASVVDSLSVLTINPSGTYFNRVSISSSSMLISGAAIYGQVLAVGEWVLTTRTRSGYAVAVATGVVIDFSNTECRFFDNIDEANGTATVVHDPISLDFVNKGYPNEFSCEPHDGNDYVDVIFPHSREVSMSVLDNNNRPIVGSKIDSRVPLKYPILHNVGAEYVGSDDIVNIPDGVIPIEFLP